MLDIACCMLHFEVVCAHSQFIARTPVLSSAISNYPSHLESGFTILISWYTLGRDTNYALHVLHKLYSNNVQQSRYDIDCFTQISSLPTSNP